MGLDNQIRRLQQQRQEHLHQAGVDYHRLQRDGRRIASPQRIVRRHVGVFMVAAGLIGMIMAPAPTYVKRDDGVKQKVKKSKGNMAAAMAARALWPHAKRAMGAKWRGVRSGSPETFSGAGSGPDQPKARVWTDAIIADVLALLARRVHWSEFVKRITQIVQQRTSAGGVKAPAMPSDEPPYTNGRPTVSTPMP